MDFFQCDLGLPHQANQFPNPSCHACNANKTDRNWFNFAETAAWRRDLPKSPSSLHVINKLCGFTPHHFLLDWLHIIDLGVSSHAMGSILYDLVYHRLSDETKPRALMMVLTELQACTSPQGVPIQKLELNNFTKPNAHLKSFPCLAFF
jgi:hypothetical protein